MHRKTESPEELMVFKAVEIQMQLQHWSSRCKQKHSEATCNQCILTLWLFSFVMKWAGGESQETPASASGMLGSGSHAPLPTVSLSHILYCIIYRSVTHVRLLCLLHFRFQRLLVQHHLALKTMPWFHIYFKDHNQTQTFKVSQNITQDGWVMRA